MATGILPWFLGFIELGKLPGLISMFTVIITGGGATYRTVTSKEREVELPEVSKAVQITTVTPTGNIEPGTGEQTIPATPTASAAVGISQSTTTPSSDEVSTLTGAGAVKAGGVVSWTGMLNATSEVLPAASLAVQATAVVPKAKIEPEAGAQAKLVTPTLSAAVTS